MKSLLTAMSLREMVWAEKYRPKTIHEILDRDEIVSKLKTFVKSKNMPHLLFVGPAGTSKTTAALALLNDMYDGKPEGNYIELNASDERGIDVIRFRVKEFARSFPIADVPFKIIVLDECDSMTDEAQQALRRTMEKFSTNTRFVLVANELYKIIEPIQSRCSEFRFGPLPERIIADRIKEIAKREGVHYEEEAIDLIVGRAYGDMRMAINLAQGAAAENKKIDLKNVRQFLGAYGLDRIDNIFEKALSGDFNEAVEILDKLLYDSGVPPREIARKIQKKAYELEISPQKKMDLISILAEVEYRLTIGADPEIQFSLFLAKLAEIGKR